jgi:hypothetical protein
MASVRDLRMNAPHRKLSEIESISTRILEGSSKEFKKRNYKDEASAVHDRNYAQNYVEGVSNAIGEPVSYIARMDSKGNAINVPFYSPELGEMVFPDERGGYKYWNADYLEKQIQIEEEIRAKVDRMMRACVTTPEMCREVLDVTDDYYKELLLPITGGGKAEVQAKMGMADEMQKIDGTVEAMLGLPSGSLLQTQALSKLRLVCRKHRHRFLVHDLHKHTAEEAAKVATNKPNPAMHAAFVAANDNIGADIVPAPTG